MNGAIVSSFLPARIVEGHVVAPVTPIVAGLAGRVVYAASRPPTVQIERDARRIVVPVAFVEHGMPFVELVPVVRGIGGSVSFDAPTKTLAIVLDAATAIATMPPFDPRLPQPPAREVFTPSPRPEPSRGIATGVPRPRRTAIPAIPSEPVGASPAATSPRR